MTNRVRTAIISFAAFIWGLNMAAGIFVHDFKPPVELNAGITGVIAALLPGYKNGEKEAVKKRPVKRVPRKTVAEDE